MSSSKLFKVFVYGTLKRGEPNHHWLTKPENGLSCFVGEGTTKEKFPLVIGTRYNIPFLLKKPGVGNNIDGEIYEVDEKMFGNLDILEDYPNYYDRELQDICINNETMNCWLYLIPKYPEELLKKTFLTCYRNTPEQPYIESYVDSVKEDMYEDV